MNEAEPLSCDESAQLASRLMELVSGSWMAQAVSVAAELRIADFLATGPKTAEELAQLTQSDSASLQRLLQALATINICRRRDDNLFEITPLGSLLESDSPNSLRSWSIWWGKHLWPVWGQLAYSVRTGKVRVSCFWGPRGSNTSSAIRPQPPCSIGRPRSLPG